jgi:hypothetical protein
MTLVLFHVLALQEIEVCKRRSAVTQLLECFDIAFLFIEIASVPPAGLSAERCYSWSRRTRRSRPWRRQAASRFAFRKKPASNLGVVY